MLRIIVAVSILFVIPGTANSWDEEPMNAADADHWWLEVKRGKELMETHQFKDAQDVLSDALKGLEAVYGKDSAELVPAISMLANTSGALGRSRQQMKLYQRALELIAKRNGKASAEYADLSFAAGDSLWLYSANRKAARAMLKDAFDIHITLFDSTDPMSARTALALGEMVLRAEEFAAAQYYFSSAVESRMERALRWWKITSEPIPDWLVPMYLMASRTWRANTALQLDTGRIR